MSYRNHRQQMNQQNHEYYTIIVHTSAFDVCTIISFETSNIRHHGAPPLSALRSSLDYISILWATTGTQIGISIYETHPDTQFTYALESTKLQNSVYIIVIYSTLCHCSKLKCNINKCTGCGFRIRRAQTCAEGRKFNPQSSQTNDLQVMQVIELPILN